MFHLETEDKLGDLHVFFPLLRELDWSRAPETCNVLYKRQILTGYIITDPRLARRQILLKYSTKYKIFYERDKTKVTVC